MKSGGSNREHGCESSRKEIVMKRPRERKRRKGNDQLLDTRFTKGGTRAAELHP